MDVQAVALEAAVVASAGVIVPRADLGAVALEEELTGVRLAIGRPTTEPTCARSSGPAAI